MTGAAPGHASPVAGRAPAPMRATVAEVLECQLRLALLRMERGMRATAPFTEARDRYLDAWSAIRPALRLLEEGRRLSDQVAYRVEESSRA